MAALTVQNFVSAASGLAVMAALARGFACRSARSIGNFWTYLVRGALYILLPLSFLMALVLVSQGVVQNLKPYRTARLLERVQTVDGGIVSEQVLPMGLAACCYTFGRMVNNTRQGWA